MTLRILIAGALALAQILPVHAHAADPAADPTIAVEIDTSNLSTLAPETAERLSLEVDDALRTAGMRRGDDGRGRLRIEVTFGASKRDLAYRVIGSADGSAVPNAEQEGACERCVTDQIVGKIDDGLPSVLAALREALEGDAAADGAAGGTGAPPAAITPVPEKSEWRRAPRIRPVGVAGIVVGAVGLAGAGVGIWLAVRPTNFEPLDDGERERGVDTRPGGIAMAAVGAAAVVVGVTMLIIGVSAPRRASVAAVPTRGGAAVSFGMRF